MTTACVDRGAVLIRNQEPFRKPREHRSVEVVPRPRPLGRCVSPRHSRQAHRPQGGRMPPRKGRAERHPPASGTENQAERDRPSFLGKLRLHQFRGSLLGSPSRFALHPLTGRASPCTRSVSLPLNLRHGVEVVVLYQNTHEVDQFKPGTSTTLRTRGSPPPANHPASQDRIHRGRTQRGGWYLHPPA